MSTQAGVSRVERATTGRENPPGNTGWGGLPSNFSRLCRLCRLCRRPPDAQALKHAAAHLGARQALEHTAGTGAGVPSRVGMAWPGTLPGSGISPVVPGPSRLAVSTRLSRRRRCAGKPASVLACCSAWVAIAGGSLARPEHAPDALGSGADLATRIEQLALGRGRAAAGALHPADGPERLALGRRREAPVQENFRRVRTAGS